MIALALAALLWLGAPAAAQELQPIPPLEGRVIDRTATLAPAQRTALDARLAALESETGAQVVVLLVPTTRPEDIADYTQRLGDAWKLGRRGVGDGLLIVVAKDDRAVRIAPAKALEGAVPDLAARQIVDQAMAPAFRAGDYAGGLDAAVDGLAARIRGEALPAPVREHARPGLQFDELAMFFFVGVPIVGALLTALLGRRLGSLATGVAAGAVGWWFSASVLLAAVAGALALLLVGVIGVGAAGRRSMGPVVWGPWGGGRGGGWGGGGGFSSGGGGDFGGGGASGRW